MIENARAPDQPTTLHLVFGKVAAGKSTLARKLAERPGTILLSLDHLLSVLYPVENKTFDDFRVLSARVRAAMEPTVVDLLRQGLSVVLDFPANTPPWRHWMRGLADRAGVAHELHVLDVPDTVCKERLRKRNAAADHPYQIDEATFDLIGGHISLPSPEEGFNLVWHGIED